MNPYAQLLMGNALLGPQTNSNCQSEPLGKRDAITATKSAPATSSGYANKPGATAALAGMFLLGLSAISVAGLWAAPDSGSWRR